MTSALSSREQQRNRVAPDAMTNVRTCQELRAPQAAEEHRFLALPRSPDYTGELRDTKAGGVALLVPGRSDRRP